MVKKDKDTIKNEKIITKTKNCFIKIYNSISGIGLINVLSFILLVIATLNGFGYFDNPTMIDVESINLENIEYVPDRYGLYKVDSGSIIYLENASSYVIDSNKDNIENIKIYYVKNNKLLSTSLKGSTNEYGKTQIYIPEKDDYSILFSMYLRDEKDFNQGEESSIIDIKECSNNKGCFLTIGMDYLSPKGKPKITMPIFTYFLIEIITSDDEVFQFVSTFELFTDEQNIIYLKTKVEDIQNTDDNFLVQTLYRENPFDQLLVHQCNDYYENNIYSDISVCNFFQPGTQMKISNYDFYQKYIEVFSSELTRVRRSK